MVTTLRQSRRVEIDARWMELQSGFELSPAR